MRYETAGAGIRRRIAAGSLVLIATAFISGVRPGHVVGASQSDSEAVARKALQAFEYDSTGIVGEVTLNAEVQFAGSARTVAAVEAGAARAVSVERADVDGDGRADLVVGYAVDGAGAVALYRGLTTSVALTDTEFAPELLATGDFDGDRRSEIAIARRDGSRIAIGETDESGSLRFDRFVDAGATFTALAAGRLDAAGNRDLLAVAAAVEGAAAVTIYDVAAEPSVVTTFELDAPATALAVTGLDRSARTALVIATETGLSLASFGAAGLEARRTVVELAGAPPPLRVLTSTSLGVIVADASGRTWRVGASSDGASLVETAGLPSFAGLDATSVATLRLNGDAIDDYAVVRADSTAPAFYVSRLRGTNIVVTTNADAGAGSLRQAILDANATAGADTIVFNLAPNELTIVLASPLPTITEAVTIDGETQPGSNGDPIVEIVGTNAGAGAHGFVITGGATTIRGLVINRFTGDGIRITTAGNNVIENNHIGTNAAGIADFGNGGAGVHIIGTDSNTIGGSVAADRNVISGNAGAGVFIEGTGATTNTVAGNYIGVTAAGTAALANGGGGVVLGAAATDNTIGGSVAGAANLISGNVGSGVAIVEVDAIGNTIQGNFIGTNVDNTGGIPNIGDGVTIASSENVVADNRIAFNGDNGVEVVSGTANLISTNSISNNIDLGIDLVPSGVTPNDNDDVDTGPNNLQNFPVVTDASSVGNTTTISGTLESTPSSTFRIEFYSNAACDSSGNGEGLTFIGFTTATTNATGMAQFQASFGIPIGGVAFVTAIAIAANGDTSEFSDCLVIATTADLSVVKSSNPDPIPVGNELTYTIVVTNTGPLPAANVQIFESTPSGTTFVSMTTTQGTCTTPAVGGTGAIVCDLGTINAGASVTAILKVMVVGPVGLTINNTVFVSTSTPESNTENNTATESTNAIAPPDILSVRKLTEPFRIRIDGTNFQPGVQVFIGNDTLPWPNTRLKNSTRIVLKGGATLKARFPKNVPVTIRVVNPDGGQDTFTFIR